MHGFQQAIRSNGRWTYPYFRRPPVGPFHPANRSALVCVTRTGQIRLLYQNPDNRWAEISAELKTSGHSDSILTHAGLVAVQGKLPRLVSSNSQCMLTCNRPGNWKWNHGGDPFRKPEDMSLPCSCKMGTCPVGPVSDEALQFWSFVPYPKLPVRSQ